MYAYAGLLFDCHEYSGAVAEHMHLQQAEAMQMAGLWSCIHSTMRHSRIVSSFLHQPKSKVRSSTLDSYHVFVRCHSV